MTSALLPETWPELCGRLQLEAAPAMTAPPAIVVTVDAWQGEPLCHVSLWSPCQSRPLGHVGIREYAEPTRLVRWALTEHRKKCGCDGLASIEERYAAPQEPSP